MTTSYTPLLFLEPDPQYYCPECRMYSSPPDLDDYPGQTHGRPEPKEEK